MIEINEIKTKRLLIRKMTLGDLNEYYEMLNHKDYSKFLPSWKPTKQDVFADIEGIIQRYNDGKNNVFWAITLESDNLLIGTISVKRHYASYKYCEIGWGINPKYHRQGYAYEAAFAFISYLYNNYDVNKIAISVWEGNLASENLAKKLGFSLEGIEREASFKDGKFYNIHRYGLLKREWNNLK